MKEIKRFVCDHCSEETLNDYEEVINAEDETVTYITACKECGHIDINVEPLSFLDIENFEFV